MDVVIGAAFGDEGKGLMTHYLASQYSPEAMVVRFNGGAQAGHTVVTDQNQRHVFRHVGSGTFAGASTFLSRFFVCNPILFLEELNALHQLELKPKVYVDPDAMITTPYDMMINQITEEWRGHQKHGSCGVGFAETIERNLHPPFSLTVADLEYKNKVAMRLQQIREVWLPKRLRALTISSLSEAWQLYIDSDEVFQLYLDQLSLFRESITVSRIDLTQSAHPIIFEGAQGLMLDQQRGCFPHVTRSHTGLKNVLSLIANAESQILNVIYVTRSYLTRHGAGPLPYELSTLPYRQAADHTNVHNVHQGALRYAWFNLPLLKSFIESDLNETPSTVIIKPRLAMTCLDQVDDQITFVDDQKICKASQADFLQKVAQTMNLSEMLCSYGPSAQAIKIWR